MEIQPFTRNIAWIAAVGDVLEMPVERKERWPYLREALSSTICIRKNSVYIANFVIYTE
jgi:hypothetical protein